MKSKEDANLIGLSDKTVVVHNAMPIVTDKELLKRAKLDLYDPKDHDPFRIMWRYSGGISRELFILGSGETRFLREKEAKEFVSAFNSLGACMWDQDADAETILRAKKNALHSAFKNYSASGRPRLTDIRKKHGFTQEEMDDNKYEHWAYYYNQAKADVIREELESIQADLEQESE